MKGKLIACLLAGALSLTCAVPAWALDGGSAERTSASPADSAASGSEIKTEQKAAVYYGKVAEIGRDAQGGISYLMMESEAYGDYRMNLSQDVVWIDSGNKSKSDPASLKVGEGIYVFHSAAATQSIPPQAAAYAIVRNIPQDISSAHYLVVEAVEQQEDGSVRIVTEGGKLHLNVGKDVGLSRYTDGTPFTLEQLKKGDRVMAWYEAVVSTDPAQAAPNHLMLLPGLSTQPWEDLDKPEPEEGAKLTMELDGKTPNMTGRYEKGTAMVPVAAVAQALGFQVTYTPKGHSALVTVESDSFQVRLDIGSPSVYGVTKLPDSVGMTAPQNYGKAPYIVDPGTTWAPAGIFEMLGKTVTLEGTHLVIQ